MVSPVAIDRLRRLQDKAEEARSAHWSVHESVVDLRDRVGKAELALHRHAPGHRLRVEPNGSVVVVTGRSPPLLVDAEGNARVLPASATPFLDAHAAGGSAASARREAAEIVRLRERLARLQGRAAELSDKGAVFGELARAAGELLLDRGWAGDGGVRDLVGVNAPTSLAS